MSIARKLVSLLLAGAICGCASVGGARMQAAPSLSPSGAQDALALLELLEHVEASALAASAK